MKYAKAAKYWTEKETISRRMDKDALWKAMEAYIQENNTCALAMGSGDLCAVHRLNVFRGRIKVSGFSAQ